MKVILTQDVKNLGKIGLKTIVYFEIATTVLIWVSTLLCAVSGAIYLFECKEFIDPRK